MLKFTAFLLGVIVCALSFECKAEIVCIHPIPLTIKELAEKEKTGVISHQVAQLNASYLISKYCDKVTEPLKAVSSVSLGGECEMEWGHRLGETVYWATCNAGKKFRERTSPSASACCLQYYRGEQSLEGWGPSERCRRNLQGIPGFKENVCKYLQQSYPSRYSAISR
jgi:hypothetical protein